MSSIQEPHTSKQFFKANRFSLVLVVLLVVSLIANLVLYRKVGTAVLVKSSGAQVAGVFDAATDTEAALLAVRRLLVVPTDEMPAIATITDLEKVKDRPFFARAQVGDKVLVYANAKRAVLYRPAEDKIVELGPVSEGSDK